MIVLTWGEELMFSGLQSSCESEEGDRIGRTGTQLRVLKGLWYIVGLRATGIPPGGAM